jgi:hypothetical protein
MDWFHAGISQGYRSTRSPTIILTPENRARKKYAAAQYLMRKNIQFL